jgi:hypothetical protein
MPKKFRISFCTSIKNRLHHLKLTLPQNIADNADYPDLQFIILDYNSDDGLEKWIEADLIPFIENAKVVYYRTNTAQYFDRSHSRNMAFKVAGGDIVCNIDADNYTGKGFATYINEVFEKDEKVFLTSGKLGKGVKPDFLGRVCMKKTDFLLTGGFDEKMDGYGFEDYDLINKLKAIGLKQIKLNIKMFFSAIHHTDRERLQQERKMKLFHALYINQITPSSTDLLILFKDNTFNKGRLVNLRTQYADIGLYAENNYRRKNKFRLVENSWIKGDWAENNNSLTIHTPGEGKQVFTNRGGQLFNGEHAFSLVKNQKVITEVIMFSSQSANRHIMQTNLTETDRKLPYLWGNGVVYKNMDYTNPIFL